MQRSPVEFFTGADKDAYWRIIDSDGNEISRSCEGFRQLGSAKNNLLTFHTLLSMDLLVLANLPSTKPYANLDFYLDENTKWRWRIKANNHEIVGASHKGFGQFGEAKNNILMTHSLISIYIASLIVVK